MDLANGPEANMNAEQHKLLTQYKELIREQDSQIKQIKEELIILNEKHNKTLTEMSELQSNCQQLKDQNALLKASKSNLNSSLIMSSEESSSQDDLKKQNEQLWAKIGFLEKELSKCVSKIY
jgi:PREDICTED: USO1 homolog, vesicle docking protein-like